MHPFIHLFAQYTSDTTSLFNDSPAHHAFNIFLYVLGIAIVICLYPLLSYLLGRIFKKAGVAAWKAWVPLYSTWIMLELGDQKGWWAVVMLIPLIGLIGVVPLIVAYYNVSRAFGKGSFFFLLAIFIPPLWTAWLALDHSVWQGPLPNTPGAAPEQDQPPQTI